jgi:hypothetical protein
MFLRVNLPFGIDSVELLQKAIAQNVAFVPGAPFFANEPQRNTLRLSFRCAGRADRFFSMVCHASPSECHAREIVAPEMMATETDRYVTVVTFKARLCTRPYARDGKIDHYFEFCQHTGAPLTDFQYAYGRGLYVTERVGMRYREPYQARDSYIS